MLAKQLQVQAVVLVGSVDVLDYTEAKRGSRGKTYYWSKQLRVFMADDRHWGLRSNNRSCADGEQFLEQVAVGLN